jgi:ferredoxin/flavodoxin
MYIIRQWRYNLKTCIYVFSGTGNSLSIAEKINNSLENSEIKLIPNLIKSVSNNEIIADYETVGFVFPNYFGSIPAIVLEFIRILNLEKAKYIFSVVTAGGGQGYSLKFFDGKLAKKGKELNYGKYVTGLSNYIVGWYYSFLVKTGKQRSKIIQNLENKLNGIVSDIIRQKNEVEKSNFFVYMVNTILTPKKIREDTRSWDKEFTVDGNCIGCKTCEKICQVGNIKIVNNKPNFQHNCQRCMACIQYCPKNAIGFNGRPLNKPRSFHPDYSASKFIASINSSR